MYQSRVGSLEQQLMDVFFSAILKKNICLHYIYFITSQNSFVLLHIKYYCLFSWMFLRLRMCHHRSLY